MNKQMLIGRVGKDPEVRHLESGRAVANFTVATSEKYKKKDGEKVEETQWHRIVAWSPLADKVIEPYVKKGDLIYLEGKTVHREYTDAEGNTKYITELVVRDLTLLGGGRKDEAPPAKQEDTVQEAVVVETKKAESKTEDIDDLPF